MNSKKIPQILAIYLPQFYENEDNNLWWGKGFTDWRSVQTAEKYFPEHNEPRIPIGRNYYDLSKKETMMEQTKLASQYGISGFCFYHYYFKNGKRELELPAENLLKWKDIHMPFCFNWASESWIRSWSRISGNVWAEKYEKYGLDSVKAVLAEQDYGDYQDWERHFGYLLPFFKDKRYIKKDGKPVFIFYSPDDIKLLREMTDCWRKLAKKAGMPGLFLIGARLNAPNDCLDAAVIYEPRNSINHLNESGRAMIKNGVRCFDTVDIWNSILETDPFFKYKTYFCGVAGYDDTPRRGKSGECLINNSPDIFKRHLTKLIQKSVKHGNEFLFINAWNEWGEGMYLEPDETYGYGYLESVKMSIEASVALDEDFINVDNESAIKKEISNLNYNVKKFKQLFNLLDKWLFLEQEKESYLSAFLKKEEIESVAIYGMAALGKHLLIQMRKENINVVFGIDRYVGQFGAHFPIYRPEDAFPDVDAIVITAYDTAAITEFLESKYRGRLLKLEEIIDTIMNG